MKHSHQENAEHEDDKLIDALDKAFEGNTTEDFTGPMRQSLAGFRQDLNDHPYMEKLTRKSKARFRLQEFFPALFRPAALAGAVLGGLIVAVFFLAPTTTPTWAQVSESFQSVPYYSGVVYIREGFSSPLMQFEFWMNRDGRVRLYHAGQVIFGQDSQVIRAFDLETKSPAEPHIVAKYFLERSGLKIPFSLETMLFYMSNGQLTEMTEVTAQVNAHADISEDLVVFDVMGDRLDPQWFRIWALRESKLPVRIRLWDPVRECCIEVFLTFSVEQPAEFFDAEAFFEELSRPATQKRTGLAYISLKDPTDKPIGEGFFNEELIRHTVTTTLAGKPWSLTDYEGKVVMFHFWVAERGIWEEELLKQIYKDYNERDDFVLVGVALDADKEVVEKYCRDHQINWLQLHEPQQAGWKNSLAQACGILDMITMGHRATWVVQKDGSLQHTLMIRECLEGIFNGLTYDSFIWISIQLSQANRSGGWTRQQAEEICGVPDRIYHEYGYEKWSYRRYNKEKTEYLDVQLIFGQNGRCTGYSSQSHIIDPAIIQFEITQDYWQQHIQPQQN